MGGQFIYAESNRRVLLLTVQFTVFVGRIRVVQYPKFVAEI